MDFITKISATLKIALSYDKEMPITIRRFPTEFEIEKLRKYEHKLVDDKEFISENEITITIYNTTKSGISKLISGGNYDFTHINPAGTLIFLYLKQPEPVLKENLVDIAKNLCKKHMKPCILHPSNYTINCKIENYQPTKQCIQDFLSELTFELENRINTSKIYKTGGQIEVKDIEICDRCGGKFPKTNMMKLARKNVEGIYCKDCIEIEKNLMKRDKKADNVYKIKPQENFIRKNWKATLGGLIIIASISVILAISSLLGII